MAARLCGPLIIRKHLGIPKAWGACKWSFPSICQAILQKILKSLFFKKKIIAAKPCIRSGWNLKHIPHVFSIITVTFHIDWWSGSRERFFLKNFIHTNMAARPCDLLIIRESPRIPKAWGTCKWSFPSICQAVLEKILKCLFFKKSLLPNHVTYDVIGGELFVPHR